MRARSRLGGRELTPAHVVAIECPRHPSCSIRTRARRCEDGAQRALDVRDGAHGPRTRQPHDLGRAEQPAKLIDRSIRYIRDLAGVLVRAGLSHAVRRHRVHRTTAECRPGRIPLRSAWQRCACGTGSTPRPPKYGCSKNWDEPTVGAMLTARLLVRTGLLDGRQFLGIAALQVRRQAWVYGTACRRRASRRSPSATDPGRRARVDLPTRGDRRRAPHPPEPHTRRCRIGIHLHPPWRGIRRRRRRPRGAHLARGVGPGATRRVAAQRTGTAGRRHRRRCSTSWTPSIARSTRCTA